jgi:hypothetical protein
MFERIEAAPLLTASHHDEVTNKNVESKQQLDRMLYTDMITKMKCMLNKLNQFTGSVIASPTVIQNNEAKVEEYGTERLLTSATDNSLGNTLQITSYLMEPEVKYAATASSAFPVNGTKHSIIILPSSEAPVFHGKHSESPMQFLIRVQEYVKSVHLCDRLTLLNGISQFLRESALEWYCQLRMSHRRPQTWEEFTALFLAQFNPPIRRARQETEWHECKQKEREMINEFLVRLYALWREQKPNETETDLVKHLLCRIRNDLFNMIRISRNASLEEIIAEVQQIEDILYRRAKDERLSNQLEQLSLQKTETLPSRCYNEGYSYKTTPGLSNEYSLYMNVATPSRYLNNQVQRTVDTKTSQQLNSYGCYSCGEYRHLARSCPTQYGDYRQRQSKPNPKKRERNPGRKDQSRCRVNNSVKSLAQLHSLETYQDINMNTRCIFCNLSCTGYCCSQCSEMNRALKFKRLLKLLEKCSESIMYYDEIDFVVKRIQQVSLLK